MNPRLKLLAHLPSAGSSEASHVSDRSHASVNVSPTFLESSVEDEAALLLSIAGICDREVKSKGFDAIFEEMPPFPSLTITSRQDDLEEHAHLKPRSEPFFTKKQPPPLKISRARSVSIDSPRSGALDLDRTASPISLTEEAAPPPAAMVSPITPSTSVRRLPLRKQSLRLAKQALQQPPVEEPSGRSRSGSVSSKDKKGRTLQANPPKGVSVKMIGRKKFSWKCYPELEQFLVANREEYLRHSALNYTVQQKQYNNRLTDELLELATKHGYLFDTQEFSFVTVRDRIRCYYKSYVQSAKKRGVLMGYAARKAGLLHDKDLTGAGALS